MHIDDNQWASSFVCRQRLCRISVLNLRVYRHLCNFCTKFMHRYWFDRPVSPIGFTESFDRPFDSKEWETSIHTAQCTVWIAMLDAFCSVNDIRVSIDVWSTHTDERWNDTHRCGRICWSRFADKHTHTHTCLIGIATNRINCDVVVALHFLGSAYRL